MFAKKRYLLFHTMGTTGQYGDAVVLMPEQSNARTHAIRTFHENGYEIDGGKKRGAFDSEMYMGIPRAEILCTSTRGEIEKFMFGVHRSYVRGSPFWDFKSMVAVKFDPSSLCTPLYVTILHEINSSIARRAFVRNMIGGEL